MMAPVLETSRATHLRQHFVRYSSSLWGEFEGNEGSLISLTLRLAHHCEKQLKLGTVLAGWHV